VTASGDVVNRSAVHGFLVDAASLLAYDHVSTPGLGVDPKGPTMSMILPLLASLLLVGGCTRPAPPPAPPGIGPPDAPAGAALPPSEPMPEAERLLVIAENQGLEYGERVEAIRSLGRLGDRGAVARLLWLSAPTNDVVALESIHAVGDIGDPRALPRLREILDEPVERQGKINTALIMAIEKLEKPAAALQTSIPK
jgi:hypothetical protein